MRLSGVNTLSLPSAALYYVNLGFKVHPLKPGSKEPLTNWGTEATRDPDKVKFFWSQHPKANIGVVMDGDYEVLDLDTKGRQNGWQSYLIAGGPPKIEWPMQVTPSGGLHLLMRKQPGTELRNFTRRGFFGGLDMRTGKAYIAAAPSVVGQRAYQWRDGDPNIPRPQALDERLQEWSRMTATRFQDLPLPEVEPMDSGDVYSELAMMDPVHREFFLEGQSIYGDLSRQAYHSCLYLFRQGWTLERLAAFGSQTWLGHFGAESPHNARDPWRWAWKYTVSAAWQWYQTEQENRLHPTQMFEEVGEEKETPGEEGGLQPGALQKGHSSITFHDQSSTAQEPIQVDSYEILRKRTETLEKGDPRGLEKVVEEVSCSSLTIAERRDLLRRCATFGGESLGVVEKIADRAVRKTRDAVKETKLGDDLGVWIEAQNAVLDPHSGDLIKKESWLVNKSREFDGDTAEAERFYLKGAGAPMPVVKNLTYNPGLPPGVCRNSARVPLYNTYRPSFLQPLRGDVSPWLNLIDSLRLEAGKEAREWLLDHLAYCLQYPGRKINHGILIGGDFGIGKDSAMEPFLRAVGMHNVKQIHGEELPSDFNEYLEGTKVVVVEEIDFGDSKDAKRVAEMMKPLLSRPPATLRVNSKRVKRYPIPNLVQLIAYTNHMAAPIHIARGERRWLCLRCLRERPVDGSAEARAWETWFTRYWNWLESGGARMVYGFLLDRDVRKFNPAARPPKTDWQRDIEGSNTTPVVAWIRECIAGRIPPFDIDIVELDDVMAAAQIAQTWIKNVPSRQWMGRYLIEAGAKAVRFTVDGHNRFVVRNREKALADLQRELETQQARQRERFLGMQAKAAPDGKPGARQS